MSIPRPLDERPAEDRSNEPAPDTPIDALARLALAGGTFVGRPVPAERAGDADLDRKEPRFSAFNNPWGFTGRTTDDETGLMYYRARYYETSMGRFVGRDPLDSIENRMNIGADAWFATMNPWSRTSRGGAASYGASFRKATKDWLHGRPRDTNAYAYADGSQSSRPSRMR